MQNWERQREGISARYDQSRNFNENWNILKKSLDDVKEKAKKEAKKDDDSEDMGDQRRKRQRINITRDPEKLVDFIFTKHQQTQQQIKQNSQKKYQRILDEEDYEGDIVGGPKTYNKPELSVKQKNWK